MALGGRILLVTLGKVLALQQGTEEIKTGSLPWGHFGGEASINHATSDM